MLIYFVIRDSHENAFALVRYPSDIGPDPFLVRTKMIKLFRRSTPDATYEDITKEEWETYLAFELFPAYELEAVHYWDTGFGYALQPFVLSDLD